MFTNYDLLPSELNTPLDFLRFGLTQANQQTLWYGHGTDNAWDEMLALVLGSLHLPFDIDVRCLQACLTAAEKSHLASQLKKRILDKIPVPYLTGQAYFAGHRFYVDERVLIPRSPFAELIEQQFSPWVQADEVHEVLDLCTGSGCIGIACAYAFPDAQVDAVDLSPDALRVAQKNVALHGLETQVTLIESDLWQHVPKKQYDLIISNPPYVSASEMGALPQEYRHEPVMALEAAREGLAIVDVILAQAPTYLSAQGILAVEVGCAEEALIEAYPQLPFTWIEFERGGEGVFILTAADLKERVCKNV